MILYLDEVAKQIEETKKEKGFFISKLSKARIILQTQKSRYEIECIEKNKALITGGTLPDKSARFATPTAIKILGSSWRGSMLRTDWIGKYMHFEFIEQNSKTHILTSSVLGAAVESIDHRWCFILDW
jgi:hypothetical protein